MEAAIIAQIKLQELESSNQKCTDSQLRNSKHGRDENQDAPSESQTKFDCEDDNKDEEIIPVQDSEAETQAVNAKYGHIQCYQKVEH
ncbi:hypothetical protein HDU80_002215 [Chytriomyces hyalinus]|nr:hypothetical protein HDU80_002215 [Chytriomyces hyalinus]